MASEVMVEDYSATVDAHTRKVTEGVYTFSGRHRPANNDRDSQSRRIFRYIFWLTVIGGLLIGIVGGCGIAYSILVKLPAQVNLVPNYSQCTTASSAAVFTVPGFNQTCSGPCQSNLICQNNTCLCSNNYHWSYGHQMCTPCTNANYNGYMDFCWSFWTSSSTSETWIKGAGVCYSVGGQLAQLENYQKFLYMQKQASYYYITKLQLWLNSTTITPKVFTWPNGDLINPAMWVPGKPNNNNVNGILSYACVTMVTTSSYFLSDASCYGNYDMMCEYYD